MTLTHPSAEFIDGVSSICKCTSHGIRLSTMSDDDIFDLGAVVKVELISPRTRNLSRDYASDGLRDRLKFAQTNIFCNDFKNEIDRLIQTHK